MIILSEIVKKHSQLYHLNQGITIAQVTDSQQGIVLAKKVLYDIVSSKTVLYLSGGRTPKVLYEQLAEEEQLKPGAVGIVDERFGEKFHDNSNEKMIRDTGLMRYLEILDIPFYPILQAHHDKQRESTAQLYDEKVRHLHATFLESVAILGIGADGHTSSIAPNRKDFKNPMFDPTQNHLLVSEFKDPKSFYGERVGMTFLGLSMIDVNIVLVFGEDKKEALEALFQDGKQGSGSAQAEHEIPSRFFKRPDVATKTLFITDQSI